MRLEKFYRCERCDRLDGFIDLEETGIVVCSYCGYIGLPVQFYALVDPKGNIVKGTIGTRAASGEAPGEGIKPDASPDSHHKITSWAAIRYVEETQA